VSLLLSLRHFFNQHGLERTYWMAYSGGLDSHVLLSLCARLRKEMALTIRAIHINHGFSSHAKQWASHCALICQKEAIDYVERTLTIPLRAGDSLEEVARKARYAAFADCLHPGDMLLTAHHQDDQAETVLMQLVRGAGLKGLSAMPVIKPFADASFHGRPLLAFSRSSLADYAKEQGLIWVEDESNQQSKLTRNFMRHEVLGLLKTRWPSVANTLARSAQHCAEAQTLLNEFALTLCATLQGSRAGTLSVHKLLELDPQKQRLVLRAWIQKLGFALPDAKKLATIQATVITAAWDRNPCVRWQDVEVRRYRDDLYVMASSSQLMTEQVITWHLAQPLKLGTDRLYAEKVQGRGLHSDIHTISIRFRQDGDVVTLPLRGRHTLKKLFQEWGVPPWERDRLPLIYLGEKLIGVLGYFLDQAYTAKGEQWGWELKS
jgi:tRNA(Ile)-lysidine synthase